MTEQAVLADFLVLARWAGYSDAEIAVILAVATGDPLVSSAGSHPPPTRNGTFSRNSPSPHGLSGSP